MSGIDKAAIGFSIAIVAAGAIFAFYMGGVQDAGMVTSAPMVTKTMEPKAAETKTQADPFADIAAKNKEAATQQPDLPVEKESMPEKQVESKTTEMKENKAAETTTAPKKPSGPQTVTAEIPAGSSTPGCEETSECFVPASITINAGDTVEWSNTDTAAHTVTAGSPADGPSGAFDSSLILGGASFAYTFEEAGSYDYFCMVHPWMVGNVQVN